MGGGAFILLKAGRSGPETAKQAENGLAGLRKILRNAAAEAEGTLRGCGNGNFRAIGLTSS